MTEKRDEHTVNKQLYYWLENRASCLARIPCAAEHTDHGYTDELLAKEKWLEVDKAISTFTRMASGFDKHHFRRYVTARKGVELNNWQWIEAKLPLTTHYLLRQCLEDRGLI